MSLATLMNSIGLGGITAGNALMNTPALGEHPAVQRQMQQMPPPSYPTSWTYAPSVPGEYLTSTGIANQLGSIQIGGSPIVTEDSLRKMVREELDKHQNESFHQFCEINYPVKEAV